MKRLALFFTFLVIHGLLHAGNVEKTYYFSDYKINNTGSYQSITFPDTKLSAFPGDPMLPYQAVALMLPPGESALTIEIIGESETSIPGKFLLYPKQYARQISMGSSGDFIINPKTYQLTGVYPASPSGHLMTQYLNGYSFALCTFTPVLYHPASGQVSYYHKVIVRVKTQADKRSAEAMKFLSGSEAEKSRVNSFAQNPDLMTAYPQPKAPVTDYQYLIICPTNFQTEFQSLIDLYATKGIITHVTTVDYISTNFTGYDLQEKIRNYIINQKQNYHIQYVLLAGNPALVPCRGFFCHVWSGGAYTTDYNIPADLYYSGLDGNYDANGNHTYAEEDDNADLLPDVAVGRFTVNDTAELHHMLHKSIAYQTNPVLGEFSRPLFIGEYLWGAPLTMGGDFMNLLIDYHTDNGYNTQGIPSASNSIRKLYDTLIPPTYTSWWSWGQSDLFSRINQGNSFMHHLGHANTDYMLRLNYTDITNSNFSQVDGIIHNYEFLYTQGCYCGAFDLSNCIAVKSVTITNFLAGGVFNSRYGWFDEGSTDGPSEHLQREFVNAMYRAVSPEKHLGMAQVISKVNTAPYIGLPGEWEPGAQRWCHFCCNVYGDPALELWTAEPSTFTTATWNGSTDSDWNKASNWTPAKVPTSLNNIILPNVSVKPVISTVNVSVCHDITIQNGGNLIINTGKSIIVRGSVILQP